MYFFRKKIGIIKPTAVIKWGDLDKRNRKNVFKYYGIGLVDTLILIAVSAPKSAVVDDMSTTAQVEKTAKELPKEKAEEEKVAEPPSIIPKDRMYKVGQDIPDREY